MTVAPRAKIRRLLFLSCTRHKRLDLELLPAVERYDGPVFRVVRRFRDRAAEMPETYILSAQFGLIRGDQLIPYYDSRMTPRRAQELRPQVEEVFRRIISAVRGRRSEQQIFFCMGKVYAEVIMPSVPPHLAIGYVGGPIGRMSAGVHRWLYGSDVDTRLEYPKESHDGTARLRGVEVRMTPEEILKAACRALPQQNCAAANYQSWFVPVGYERVSPKWLVSLITGLPVSAFHTGEARRLLHRLGIEVCRTEF